MPCVAPLVEMSVFHFKKQLLVNTGMQLIKWAITCNYRELCMQKKVLKLLNS